MIELNDGGGGKRPFLQKNLFLFTIGYFAILAVLALFIYRASPGPESQEILGVGIGSWQSETGVVFLSGRRLDCNPANESSSFATVCQVEIAGKTLEIYALRNKPTTNSPFMGLCEAFYDGKQWPCSFGSRHVDVNWFAYINPPLELNGMQMDGLRRHYFIENLAEEPFLYGGVITAVITTILILANFTSLFWTKVRRKWVLWLTAVPIMFVTFYGSLLIAVIVTRGFWD